MSPWIAKGGRFLLLGAASTVAVAWMCAFFAVGVPLEQVLFKSTDPPDSPFHLCDGGYERYAGVERVWLQRQTVFEGPFWRREEASGRLPRWSAECRPRGVDDQTRRLMEASGWPAASMRGGFDLQVGLDNYLEIADVHAAVVLPWRIGWGSVADAPLLPLRPIWTGFAIDAIFFAMAGWLALAMPRAYRRRSRRQRGCCPKCGRRVNAAGTCAECGQSAAEASSPNQERPQVPDAPGTQSQSGS